MKINLVNQTRLEALKRIGCIVCGQEGHIVHPTATESFSDVFIVCDPHDVPSEYDYLLTISEDYLSVVEQIS